MARRGSIAGAVTAAAVALAALFGVNQALSPGGLYETKRTLWPAYQAAPRSWDKWGPTTTLDSRIHAVHDRLRKHDGESFQLKASSAKDWSVLRNLNNTMITLRDRMNHAPVGAVWFVRAKKDGYQEGIRKKDLNPAKAVATEGTDAIDIVVGTLRVRWPGINVIGIYSCRTTISGSISQHAHANAVDVVASYDYMNRVAHDMYSLTQKGYIPVSQILWNYKNMLSGNYVYDHTNHIHFSGDPLINRTGCARASSMPTTEGVDENEDEYGPPEESEEEFASPPPDLGATGPTGGTTP